MNEQVAGLAAQVEQLTQTVATLTGILFGDSSEKKKPPRQPDGRDGDDDGDGVQGRGPGRRNRGQRTGAPGHGRQPVSAPGNRGAHPGCRSGAAAVPLLRHRLRVHGHRGFGAGRLAGDADPDPVAAAAVPAALRLPGEAGRPGDGVRAPAAQGDTPGLFTEMFLARLAYEKYVLGRPLHRIIAALAADGLDVAKAAWSARWPRSRRCWPRGHGRSRRTWRLGYVRADETSWRVLPTPPAKTATAGGCGYSGPMRRACS